MTTEDRTTNRAPLWTESYLGGSPQAERRIFEGLAVKIMQTQARNRAAAGGPVTAGFQAKGLFATADAELRFLDIAPDLRAGFAQPGAVHPTAVRFSNAEGRILSDHEADLRGAALRVTVSPGEHHDLLMTSAPVSHARDARQFAEIAVATAGGGWRRHAGLVRLVFALGPGETVRVVRNLTAGRRRVPSLATETFWSRVPIAWGDTAVQYLLRPAPGTPAAGDPPAGDPDFLGHELASRLSRGDVSFELCVQRFRDPRSTPIEDAAADWRSPAAPPEPIAVLTLRAGAADDPAVHALRFNPWNTTDEFRPLGNLNRVRKVAYDASAAHRDGQRWLTDVPLRNHVAGAAMRAVFGVVNRFRPWHRLPTSLALLNLAALRDVLRRENLIDTEVREAPPRVRPVPVGPGREEREFRTHEGRSNDLSEPEMGAVGAAFGRNVPAVHRPDLVDEPNPIVVSRELLHRDTFRPATSLNILAAAWIQFQVHDWVVHARHPLGTADVKVPLPPDMPGWVNTPGGPAEPWMRIGGNASRGVGADGVEELFGNVVSHWWDGSEVYGTDSAKAAGLRDGAKLRMTPDGYLPLDVAGAEITGFNEAWWLGLSSMHTLFAREHNLLCDELRGRNPDWSDERVYQTARLIVSALIAKIHTVEWTPAILNTEVLRRGMNVNWYGVPANDLLSRIGLWLTDANALRGIPATTPDHHGTPFSLTEDFVTVYRMHPLIPDEYAFRDAATGAPLRDAAFPDLRGDLADDVLRDLGLTNVLYSFGTAHPGAIALHNYPRSLLNLEREGELIDLSVVDLVRTRRRGVPRYNDFRAALHLPRIQRWEDLSSDPETVRRLRAVYRDIDEVDTMVGLFAETPPDGFGFSDTAFRVFILMASRRLQSDRFLTADYRPEIYTQFGLDWISSTSMTGMIHRHCPDLAATLPAGANAFAPWPGRAASA
ncbi:peroxidase family protein [Actinoplanes sp. NPDC051861]|uniref:peroxidase family protein n=1 Tax=Actinoplanes sp. NPDC051861 TaxID=3155170 RepID=UPI003439D41D